MIGHLGLGANLGDRRAALQAAVDGLAAHGVEVRASSSVYETDPVGLVLDQPAFLNAVVAVESALEPHALLDAAKALEDAAGRDQGAARHSARPLDVDLLLLGGVAVSDHRLTVPHPALRQRRFVLVPLLELDLALRTPAGESLADALAVLPLDDEVRHHGPPLTLRRGPRPSAR